MASLKYRVSYRLLQRLAGLARSGKGLPIQVERGSWLTIMFVAGCLLEYDLLEIGVDENIEQFS